MLEMLIQIMKNRVYYGYVIVAAGMLILAATLGIVQNCTSLFIPEICNVLQVSRTSAQLLFSFFSIGSVLSALCSSVVYSRFEPAKLMKIAALFLAPVYFLNSLSHSIWQFYLIAFLVGAIQTFMSVLPITLIVSSWFTKNKGKIIGITLTGSTIGGALFNQIAGRTIPVIGFRQTYALLALIMLICTVPAAFFLIRSRPAQESDDETGDESRKELLNSFSYSLKELKKQPLFWLFLIAITLNSISGISANTTISPHLVNIGYSTQRAANIISMVMLAMTAGKFILGLIFDRIGVMKTTVLSQVILCLAFVGLLLIKFPLFEWIVIISIGLGGVLVTVGYPLITEYSFGNKEYSGIYGLVTAFSQAGNMLASLVTGVFYDRFGNYYYSYILLIVFTVISTLIILRTMSKYHKENTGGTI